MAYVVHQPTLIARWPELDEFVRSIGPFLACAWCALERSRVVSAPVALGGLASDALDTLAKLQVLRLAGLRDRALLYFGFSSGGRRRSEVATAAMKNLRALPEGGFVYRLDVGKTLQSGPSSDSAPDKPILGAAAEALQAWLKASEITEGAVFRRVWSNTVGPGLSGETVAGIIKRRAGLAGLEGDFGGHSLRSGFITEGARRGIALPALMAMTDHRSVASVVGYFQAGAVERNPAARLHEDDAEV